MRAGVPPGPGSGAAALRRLLPRRIAGQITVLVVASIVGAHLLLVIPFLLLRPDARALDERPGASGNRLVALVHVIAAAPADQRPLLVAAAQRGVAAVDLALLPDDVPPPEPTPSPWPPEPPEVTEIRAALGDGYTVEAEPGEPPPAPMRLRIRGPDDLRLEAQLPLPRHRRPPITGFVLSTLAFLALSLALLSVWAARALTAPLGRLADAAEAFGREADPAPLPESGPEEVLAASRALGRMRARVSRLLDDRTHMLAAISHDLRTPITRLRLRAEFLEDEVLRGQVLADLAQMNALVDAALSFVRDGGPRTSSALVDLASLVQTVCDGFSDIGQDVRAEDLHPTLTRGSAEALQRALINLVDNAVKYGGGAVVRLAPARDGEVAVEVLDEGPGIPEEERGAMLRPFVRGDRARTLGGTGGFGLGLAIAHAIAEAHGGRLALENRTPRGLRALLRLPAVAPAPRGG